MLAQVYPLVHHSFTRPSFNAQFGLGTATSPTRREAMDVVAEGTLLYNLAPQMGVV